MLRELYKIDRMSAVTQTYSSSAVAEMGDRLATIDMSRKLGGECAPLGGAGSPSNTLWPRPTSVPSDITY